MKRFLLLVFLFGAFTLFATAAALDTTKQSGIRSLTLRGLEYAYNLDFENAEKMFSQAHAIEPLHPRPILGKASMMFWRVMIQKDDSSYQALLAGADAVIDAG